MMKKQITLYFLFIACFLQLGHSLFPHTHVKEHHHDGTSHHHHRHDSNENELSLFFSHFNHTSEVFSNSHLEEVAKVVNEIPSLLLVVNTNSDYSDLFVLRPRKEVSFYEEPSVIISPHLYSLQFRGPPVLI
ncbi:MAG: hypothetical protein ACJAYP_001368 [Flavobacterium sp.]|jgi:hypothetical protein